MELESQERHRYMRFYQCEDLGVDMGGQRPYNGAMLRLLIITALLAPVVVSQDYTWREALDAIRHVETGTHLTGVGVVGDDGHALGPYQIWSPYWIDARMDYGTHGLCLKDRLYAEQVVRAYMLRYSRKCTTRLLEGRGTLADVERISRIHNGGPKGYTKLATRKYWAQVQIRLALVRKMCIIGSIN